jgi:hypothetical protein
LEDGEVDIAILCLAMWGSNCHDYIIEANRILDKNGNKLEKIILESEFILKKYHNFDKFMFGEFIKK